MKPNFALDLSHEGINLLHRNKGGWSLVGSVALDDPNMGARLDDLRRSAAMLESGGFTTKLIIPNSQLLYTTVDAAGPDDISREVQIRAALDGLTPYAVGDLVFDWRAEGDRARVAVLARETMDEAETFASEYKLNPVSFVARPDHGDFSGEPFFGKTRAATRLLPPGARLEPDASPVPRNPRALELSAEARVDPPAQEVKAEPAPEPAPEVPQVDDLPDAPAVAEDVVEDTAEEVVETGAEIADPTPDSPPVLRPEEPIPDTAPAPAPKRKPRAERGEVARVSAPALAPFPPTPDELAANPAIPPRGIAPVSRTSKVPRSAAPQIEAPAKPQRDASPDEPAPTPPIDGAKAAPAPGANGLDQGDAAQGEHAESGDDHPPAAFQSRRTGAKGSGDESASAEDRQRAMAPRIGIGATPQTPSPAGDQGEPTPPSSDSAPAQPPRKVMAAPGPIVSPANRIRGEMADVLSRPLPSPDQPKEKPSKGGNLFAGFAGATRTVTGRAVNGLKSAGKSRSEARRSSMAGPGEPAAADAKTVSKAPVPNRDTAGATPRKGFATLLRKRKSPGRSEAEEKRAREAEALTVFGARKAKDTHGRPKYLGLILTLLLLLAMAVLAVWSSYVIDDDVTLFNPDPGGIASPEAIPTAPTPEQPEEAVAEPEPPADTAAVLSPDAAEARYAATGIWQRAPEPLAEPETTRLSTRDLGGLTPAMPERAALPGPGETPGRLRDAFMALPVPPPPPGTSFDLDENGLVRPTPEGALSPTGILVFSGQPARVPPPRPGDLPDVAPPLALPDVPNLRPRPRPADLVPPATVTAPPESAPEAEANETPPSDDNAALPAEDAPSEDEIADLNAPPDLRPAPRPAELVVSTASSSAAIEAAVSDAIAAALVNPTELAVVTSRKPSHRPSDFAAIVDAAREAASDGSRVAMATPVNVTPAIPTSASVATQATVKNAINLREINLIGIYGTSSARRALVRMKNGRYVKVEVGDALDGGRVTSITATELTYQKGNRAYKLGVLPLG